MTQERFDGLYVAKDSSPHGGRCWIVAEQGYCLSLFYERDGMQKKFPIQGDRPYNLRHNQIVAEINSSMQANTPIISDVYSIINLEETRDYDMPKNTYYMSIPVEDKNTYILQVSYVFSTKFLLLVRSATKSWNIVGPKGDHQQVLAIFDDNQRIASSTIYSNGEHLKGKRLLFEANGEKHLSLVIQEVISPAIITAESCAQQHQKVRAA